jgi:hypothetical protein
MPRRKGKTLRESAGYKEDTFVPREFPREIIAEMIQVDEPAVHHSYPRMGDRKYTVERVTAILDAIVNSMPPAQACEIVDIDKRTFYRWKAERPDFLRLVTRAQAYLVKDYTGMIHRAAPDNWTAAMTFLERQFPDEFSRKDRVQHVHEGEVGLNIQAILQSAESIAAASALEAALQQEEDLALEGEIIKELPAHVEDEG